MHLHCHLSLCQKQSSSFFPLTTCLYFSCCWVRICTVQHFPKLCCSDCPICLLLQCSEGKPEKQHWNNSKFQAGNWCNLERLALSGPTIVVAYRWVLQAMLQFLHVSYTEIDQNCSRNSEVNVYLIPVIICLLHVSVWKAPLNFLYKRKQQPWLKKLQSLLTCIARANLLIIPSKVFAVASKQNA